jgi:hypothetical protein
LFFDRPHDAAPVENIGRYIFQRTQPGAVGEDMGQGERFFSRPTEFRPKIDNARMKTSARLLHGMQRAGRSHALRGRPDEHKRFMTPWQRSGRIAKASTERDSLATIPENAQSGTDLDAAGEVVLESLPDAAHN